jgi:hypothetical protein
MYESFVTKRGVTKKIFNMTEITSPWAFEDSVMRAFRFKHEKYDPIALQFGQLNPGYSEVRVNVIVVSPSGVFPEDSQKEFAIATHLKRGDLATHARYVVDAAITSAFEHYGTYCKAMGYKENVKGARSRYTEVEQEFQLEANDMDVVDSIQDVEPLEIGEQGPLIAREVSEITAYEIHKASIIEQQVREKTGLRAKPITPNPDGLKRQGKDDKDDVFGKAYTRVRKTKPGPAPVSYTRTMKLRTPEERSVDEVEVFFASCGNYTPFIVRTDATQEQIETLSCEFYQGNFGLIDFRPPVPGIHYRFKAMFCQDRDNAAWLACQREDTADEEWVLFGQELSDNDIIRVMEQRWFVPLKNFKKPLPRPLENNSTVMFEKRRVDDEPDEEEISVIPAADPMQLFTDRTWYKPPRPSTPVCFQSIEQEFDDQRDYEDGIPKIIHEITAGPHRARLVLRQDATSERILDVLHRRT